MISALRGHGLAVVVIVTALFVCVPSYASATEILYGTLISDTKLAAEDYRAGVRLATVGLSWGRYMPQKGRVDEAYVNEVRSRIKVFTDIGMRVVLDLGMHVPPAWIFDIPHSRFVNQYGDAFVITNKPGLNAVNGVFNQTVRDIQALYAARVFSDLGTNFYGVRIGWGHYSELHYAWKGYNGKKNCYWGFDDIAQGKAPGLAAGVKTCPVSGWLPGTPSGRHTNAAQFIEWYLDSLAQYQQFQITTLRKSYAGYLIALYANWGIRPGQIAEAVADDLDGSSFAERYEQTHKGYDVARFIASIQDDKVIVCGTCVNANSPWPATNNMVDDAGDDPAAWSPIHFISSCAARHRPPLSIGGENDGNDDVAGMRLSFERVRAYGLSFFMWAFDFQLHDKDRRYATIEDYKRHIAEQR
ncbi:MAG: hypothetical protein HZC28_05750 [Spirochaetes bacterium]|nr:hypothetical protein [Spirochaetota bacterium]